MKPALLLVAVFSAFAQTLIEPRIVSETLPAGGLMQIKLDFTSPHPITTSGADFAMDLAFDGVEGVAMMSPAGDGYGVAVVQGQSFRSNLVSPLASLGTQLDYPFLTIATKIKPGLAAGTKVPINFGTTTFFNGPGGTAYSMPFAKNGVLTVGGSVSVTNVVPGGGQLPAGTVIRLLGTGFSADTKVDVGEATISREQFISPTEIQLTLGAATNMTGKRIRVKNRDNSEAVYYSYLRAVAVGASSRPLLNASHPLYPDQTATSAGVVLPATPANGFVAVALRNMGLSPVTAELQLVSSAGAVLGTTTAALPGGSQFMRTAQEMFGTSPAGATVRVTASGALQVLGLRGDESTGNVTAFLPGATPQVTPELVAAPATMVFDATAGAAAPPAKTLTVTSTGSAIAYTVSSNAAWLSVSPVSGATPGTHSIGANVTGLAAGNYTGSLTISAAGAATQTVAVTLNVAPAPQLSVSPAALSFTASGSQTVAVTSSAAPLAFTVSSSATWLTATPASGTTPGNLTVTVNTAGLAPGSQTGTLTIAAPGAPARTVAVTLTVAAQQLAVAPSTLAMTGAGAQTVSVTSSGAAVAFSAVSSAAWLTVTPATGTTPAAVSVSTSTTGLSPGTYTGQVTFSAAQAGLNAPVVTVTLTVVPEAQLTLTPPSLAFTATAGFPSPAASTVNVGSSGAAISFRASTAAPWITVTPATGQTPGALSVAVNSAGLAAGTYSSLVTVELVTGGTAQTLPVSLQVAAAPRLVVSPGALVFDAPSGGAAVSKMLAIASDGPALTYTATSSAAWLRVSPVTGQTGTPASITADPAALSPGTYTGVITVTPADGAAVQTVGVTFNVSPSAALNALPASLAFDGSSSRTLTISSNAGPLTYSVSSNAAWLTATPASGQTPGTLTVTANATGQSPGLYTGQLTVTANGAPPLGVPVTLTVAGPAGQVLITPAALTFNGAGTRTLSIASTGPALSFVASAGASWLSVSPATGQTPATLTVIANPAGLAPGPYISNITVNGESVPVTLTVPVPPVMGTAPEVAAVVNGASQLAGQPLAPGQIVTIYGARLGPAIGQGPILIGTRFVETLNAGTRVWFGSTPAPILFTSAGQVNAVVPYEVSGLTRLEVEFQGQRSAAREVNVAAAAPAIFTQSATGSGRAAVLNQDYSLNTAQRPAARGSVIMIYATGGGQTTPPSATGEIAGTDLRTSLAPVTVTIGGRRCEILYSGVAPGLVTGLLQINVVVPLDAPAGDNVPITVAAGGITSRDGPAIALE